jgi:hypothetical protein
LTCESNIRWLDSLELMPLLAQIQAIKERVIADTNIYINQSKPDGVIANKEIYKNKYQGCCKPLWILYGYLVSFDDLHPQRDIFKFLQIIDQIKIEEIRVLTSKNSTALYGTAGGCGVVLVVVKDRRSLKLLKKLYGRKR